MLPIYITAQAVLDALDYAAIAVNSNCAPPDPNRIRKHTMAGFLARRMRVLAPHIRTRPETLVAQMLAGGELAEIVRPISHLLPGETVFSPDWLSRSRRSAIKGMDDQSSGLHLGSNLRRRVS